ncbi:MAG: Crp/Fnr family transcriptional regulator [Acidovorax sp.]|nr:Crp/Fnr family transcriptional regulator [Acidovorax sp.]
MDTQHFDVARYLANLPLFQETTAQELQRLAAGCRLRRFGRGEAIFRVGMPCEEFHVTVMGQVKLFAISPAGQEKVIEIAGPGITFAEALMFTERPYIINAQALSDTLLLSVGKDAVVDEIERDPRFALRLLGGISRRLHGLVHDVQAYSLHSGMQRVIGYLLSSLPEESARTLPTLEAYAGQGCAPVSAAARPVIALKVSLPVSKATIASLLSITPEYFSRVLRDLETEGLIHIDKRDILIPDAMRLAHYTP